jgi:UbiD family decarboxylase
MMEGATDRRTAVVKRCELDARFWGEWMSLKASILNLRSFLAELEAADAASLLRIPDPVDIDFEVTAIAMELERQGRSPVLWFENVGGSPFPVVTNLFGSRSRFALALGVSEEELTERWATYGDTPIEPVMCDTGPILDVVRTGADVDLACLPIMRHFAEDGGRYITNGIVVAKDPDSGVRNASYHRLQIKGKRQCSTSLHSRRHLWTYVERAEARDEATPVCIVVGGHPRFAIGSGLWKGSIEADEYAVAGGFLGQPLALVQGITVPVESPAQAEFVLEGHILPGVREPEGPFAEFTGYASHRSTRHMIEITAILHRKEAIYQDIVPGISNEHTNLLAVPMEARLLKVLRQNYPNVTGVAMPKSGTCRMHVYIAMHNPAPGQAKNAAMAAFGEDLSLKLAVVVDDDVDIRSDQDVLWSMCTRMQADTDIDVLKNCMGAILDPSNQDGRTAKMVIDATRPCGDFPARHSIPLAAVEKARALLARHLH